MLVPGGTPQDTRSATWSPDGAQLVLSGGTAPVSLVFLDLRTKKTSRVPASDGLAEPIWSPDGRYICATKSSDATTKLYDVEKEKWSDTVLPKECWLQRWTRDSKSVYCMQSKGVAIHRYDVETGRSEQVVSLKDYRPTGNIFPWFGLSPDGSPLILNEVGVQEIYSLELQAP